MLLLVLLVLPLVLPQLVLRARVRAERQARALCVVRERGRALAELRPIGELRAALGPQLVRAGRLLPERARMLPGRLVAAAHLLLLLLKTGLGRRGRAHNVAETVVNVVVVARYVLGLLLLLLLVALDLRRAQLRLTVAVHGTGRLLHLLARLHDPNARLEAVLVLLLVLQLHLLLLEARLRVGLLLAQELVLLLVLRLAQSLPWVAVTGGQLLVAGRRRWGVQGDHLGRRRQAQRGVHLARGSVVGGGSCLAASEPPLVQPAGRLLLLLLSLMLQTGHLVVLLRGAPRLVVGLGAGQLLLVERAFVVLLRL